MKIGVISDTHNFFDPQIPELFKGVGHILHAGDIGLPWVLLELEQIAPVTAVLGNNDTGLAYNETEVINLADRKFLVHHIVNPKALDEKLQSRITLEKPDVVVFGHSHRVFNEVRDGRLYFNPGYAGKPRFNDPRSIAILHCTPKKIRAEIIDLGREPVEKLKEL
jgi:putative phosphoesterase